MRPPTTYFMVTGRVPGGPYVLGRLRGVGGETAFPLYTTAAAAEAHALLMGPGLRVSEWPPTELREFIEEFASDDGFVALDPPLAEEGGEPEPVLVVSVEEFLGRLREEEAREEEE